MHVRLPALAEKHGLNAVNSLSDSLLSIFASSRYALPYAELHCHASVRRSRTKTDLNEDKHYCSYQACASFQSEKATKDQAADFGPTLEPDNFFCSTLQELSWQVNEAAQPSPGGMVPLESTAPTNGQVQLWIQIESLNTWACTPVWML